MLDVNHDATWLCYSTLSIALMEIPTTQNARVEQAYAAIGRAVIAMQMLEATFVSIHKGFKMITDKAYRETTGGMIDEKKYKTATANVIKTLSDRGQIAADLEERLNTLIEQRNELMHRWILHKGCPARDDVNPASYAEVIELAGIGRRILSFTANRAFGVIVEFLARLPIRDSTIRMWRSFDRPAKPLSARSSPPHREDALPT